MIFGSFVLLALGRALSQKDQRPVDTCGAFLALETKNQTLMDLLAVVESHHPHLIHK